MNRYVSALAAICLSVLAQDACAGGREPGSVLIYPVHRSGLGLYTAISVTNTNLTPATVLSLGGSTNVHFHYVNVTPNPLNAFRPLGCTIFDRVETLTPADTLTVLTNCHNIGGGALLEGYLVVVAESPTLFQTPWSHNHLIGSEIVLSASGLSYTMEAMALRSLAPAGASTDLDSDAHCDFDGVEYETLPDKLLLDSFISEANSYLALVALTGSPVDLNRVMFSVWNDFEVPLSATLEFKCWFEQPLGSISSLFTWNFLVGMPNDPQELDSDCDGLGDMETGWAIIQNIGVIAPGGSVVATDGALMGALTSGPASICNPKRSLGESSAKQANGAFAH